MCVDEDHDTRVAAFGACGMAQLCSRVKPRRRARLGGFGGIPRAAMGCRAVLHPPSFSASRRASNECIFAARASFFTIFGALERGFQGHLTHVVAFHLMHRRRRASVPKAPVRSQRNDPAEPLGEVGWGADVASVPAVAGGNIFFICPLGRVLSLLFFF